MSLLPIIPEAGSITFKEAIMPAVIYIRKPVGNGWTIVKAIKIPPANEAA